MPSPPWLRDTLAVPCAWLHSVRHQGRKPSRPRFQNPRSRRCTSVRQCGGIRSLTVLPGSASVLNFLVGQSRSLTLDIAAQRQGQAVAARIFRGELRSLTVAARKSGRGSEKRMPVPKNQRVTHDQDYARAVESFATLVQRIELSLTEHYGISANTCGRLLPGLPLRPSRRPWPTRSGPVSSAVALAHKGRRTERHN